MRFQLVRELILHIDGGIWYCSCELDFWIRSWQPDLKDLFFLDQVKESGNVFPSIYFRKPILELQTHREVINSIKK
jgi:hypothetical protein